MANFGADESTINVEIPIRAVPSSQRAGLVPAQFYPAQRRDFNICIEEGVLKLVPTSVPQIRANLSTPLWLPA